MDDISPPLIDGIGTLEQEWQSWRGLADLPNIELPVLIAHRRVVIVSPHPDDEILGSGGLIASLNNKGYEILLIALTNGEASHPGSTLWPPSILNHARCEETSSALNELGGRQIQTIRAKFEDGAIADKADQVQAFLESQIASNDAIVCPWRHDGHPDHNAVGAICAQIASSKGALLLETPIWAWHWAIPGDSRLPWKSAMKIELSPYVIACKRNALGCFASQILPDPSTGKGPILPDHVLERFYRPYEVFFVGKS